VILGAAFLLAGGSKLAARDAWPAQARGLHAPEAVIPVVPWWELLLGALLVVQVGRPVVAALALATMIVFTVLIARRLAAGDHPPCACVGAWSATPIGPRHLVRNGVLMVLAVLAML
jgi:uncharacterized membrane protein YphA (DoxX/SURF4 family)